MISDVVDIQDTSPVRVRLRGWQGVLAAGLAVLTASTTTVVLASSDPASADTVISVERLAQVYLPDGTNHPAVVGEHLPKGAEVHTGADGGAQLVTAGRTVYLGATTTLKVIDGVHEALLRPLGVNANTGQVMVDARSGPRLDLTTISAGTVKVAAHGLARVEERGFYVRLADYDGGAGIVPAGRSATTTVQALHQVDVPNGSLPRQQSALHLQNDSWDRALASDLVSNDLELTSLVKGLESSDGQAVYEAAPASLHTTPLAAPGLARGQDALALAITQASTKQGTDPATLLDEVRTDYALGGSWGVIAAIYQSRVGQISSLLDAALTPAAPPATGPVLQAGPGPSTTLATPTPVTSASPSPAPGGTATANPTRGTTQHPTGKPSTGPTVTPTTPPPGAVDQLLNTVVGLLNPSPKPSSTTGVLGGILGGGH